MKLVVFLVKVWQNCCKTTGILTESVISTWLQEKLRKQGVVEMLGMTADRVKKASLCAPKYFSFFCTLIHFLIGGPNHNYVDSVSR